MNIVKSERREVSRFSLQNAQLQTHAAYAIKEQPLSAYMYCVHHAVRNGSFGALLDFLPVIRENFQKMFELLNLKQFTNVRFGRDRE